MSRYFAIAAATAACVAAAVTTDHARAQGADAPFFKGKQMTIIVSTGAGGSYFNLAHMFKRVMPRYIGGAPDMLVKAMPGAGNVLATNYLYNVAAQDGTVIGTVNNSIPLHQVIDGTGVRYDAAKFHWLGSTGSYNSVFIAWHTTGVTSIDDVFKKEVIYGGTGPASSIVIYPNIMNKVLGAKFKILIGYKSVQEIDLAMQRGEVHGRTGSYTSFVSESPDWVRDKKINVLLQVGSKRDKALPNLPMMHELAKNDADRRLLALMSSPIAVGRPYLAPPGAPADRVAQLRDAFQKSMRDKDFLAEAAKLNHEIDPVSAEELTQTIKETMEAPPGVVARARELMPKREPKKKKKAEE